MAAAAAEIRERGVCVVTLDDVGRRSRTGKSQLFHYFPDGKEQLLLAVAEREADQVLQDQQPHLGQLTSWDAWREWRDVVVEKYRRQGRELPARRADHRDRPAHPGGAGGHCQAARRSGSAGSRPASRT